MAKAKYTFIGSQASRLRTMVKSPRRPKFALGAAVISPDADLGVIDAVYADLAAAAENGNLGNPKQWLARLERKPKTPVGGIWYSVLFGEGTGIYGELDLRIAPAGSRSRSDD